MLNKEVVLHYDPAQSLRCINYVLAIIGTSDWREDIAKSFLLEAQAHLTPRAVDLASPSCSVCGEEVKPNYPDCPVCGTPNH